MQTAQREYFNGGVFAGSQKLWLQLTVETVVALQIRKDQLRTVTVTKLGCSLLSDNTGSDSDGCDGCQRRLLMAPSTNNNE